MNTAREISAMTEEECIQALSSTAQPGSITATSISARLQQLQLAKLSGHTAELGSQVTQLVAIAEQQRILAAKLDGQTETLIALTRWLKLLTIWLVILTLLLCAFETHHFITSRHRSKSETGQSAHAAPGSHQPP